MSDIAACVEKARQSWNAGNLEGYLDLYDAKIRLHGYAPEPMDKESVVGFYRMICGALAAPGKPNPDLVFHEVMVDGAMYCCRFTMSGVHQGEFMGVPATGLPYARSCIDFCALVWTGAPGEFCSLDPCDGAAFARGARVCPIGTPTPPSSFAEPSATTLTSSPRLPAART